MLLEAYTDPAVPPLPPHITFEQAKAYPIRLVQRRSGCLGYIKSSAKEIASLVLPETD